jgi:hypothetical protein
MAWAQKKGGGAIEEWTPNNRTSGTLCIKFTPKALEYLASNGLRVNEVLACETARTKSLAIVPAYTRALSIIWELLAKLGIDEDYLSDQKYRLIAEDPELKPYYTKALARAQALGFASIYTKVPRIGSKGCYAQLIGERADGYLEVLKTIPSCSQDEAMKEILMLYANGE